MTSPNPPNPPKIPYGDPGWSARQTREAQHRFSDDQQRFTNMARWGGNHRPSGYGCGCLGMLVLLVVAGIAFTLISHNLHAIENISHSINTTSSAPAP
jgi:hypothetical protein